MRTLTTVAVFVLIGLVTHLIWPQALRDWTGLVVVPDSAMEPGLGANDVVFVQRDDTYEPGVVVAFRDEGDTLVGRVIGGTAAGYVVKGDSEVFPYQARPSADTITGAVAAELPPPLDVVGRGLARVPSHVAAALLGALLVAWSPWRLRRRHAERHARLSEGATEVPLGPLAPTEASEPAHDAARPTDTDTTTEPEPQQRPVDAGTTEVAPAEAGAGAAPGAEAGPVEGRTASLRRRLRRGGGGGGGPCVRRIPRAIEHDGHRVRVPSLTVLDELAQRHGTEVLVQRRDDGTDRWLLPEGDLLYEYAAGPAGATARGDVGQPARGDQPRPGAGHPVRPAARAPSS